MAKEWYPAALLERKASQPYAVIILNQQVNKNALNTIIQDATLLVCADAGADRLVTYEKNTDVNKRRPDAIAGDLDSVSAQAKE